MTREEFLRDMYHVLRGNCAQEALNCLCNHDKAQRARIAELEKEREWQPIETAPRDQTWVLGANARLGAYGIEILRYDNAEGWCNAEGIEDNPTHWMPLPAPPSAEEKP